MKYRRPLIPTQLLLFNFLFYIGVWVCVLNRFSHTQLFATQWNSLPGSSAYSILQASILEWIAISFPRGSS